MYILPERNAVVIPDFEGERYKIFPYALETFQYLAWKGINLPSMMRQEYAFNSQFPSAMAHQIDTADFLVQHPRGFVFNQIGTGKTLPVLWALDYLKQTGRCKKVLICSTVSTLDTVWADEIFKSFPHRTCAVLYGTKKKRLKELGRDVDYYIINHEGLSVMCNWKIKNEKKRLVSSDFDPLIDFTHIVVDECAMFRNASTDRYKALKHIIEGRRNLWMVSGSPMPKSPVDIWAQAKLVSPRLFSKSMTRFRDTVMFQQGLFKWIPRKGWEKIVYKELKNHCIRFERKDCLDLPPVVVKKRKIEMTVSQAKAYKAMKSEFCVELKEGRITAANEGVKLGKLLQISCGFMYDRDRNPIFLDVSKKLKDLDLLLEMAGKKVIIYTPFTASCEFLTEHISKIGSVALVNGNVSKNRRTKIFNDFQRGDLDYIVAHPQPLAHGVNMTASHIVIWWTPIDNYEIYEQASERITRAGQKHKQTIVHMSCSETEDKVYARLKNKESMQGLLMELLLR